MRLRVKLVPRSVGMVAFVLFNRADHEMAVEFYNLLALPEKMPEPVGASRGE